MPTTVVSNLTSAASATLSNSARMCFKIATADSSSIHGLQPRDCGHAPWNAQGVLKDFLEESGHRLPGAAVRVRIVFYDGRHSKLGCIGNRKTVHDAAIGNGLTVDPCVGHFVCELQHRL